MKRAPAPGGAEDAGHDRRHGGVADADQLVAGPGRVGERPEEVEHGRHAELLADRADEAHGRVEALGEAEPHAGLGTQRATPSGPSSMATPSASSTSAVPTDDDAARLPCLHTGTPHPAVMNEASVVTLMLARRSPPVPTRSTTTVSSWSGPAGRAPRRRPWPGPARSPPRPSRPWRAAGSGRRRPGPAWPRPRRRRRMVASSALGRARASGAARTSRPSSATRSGQVSPTTGPGRARRGR